jgi:hypothetical protein
MVNFKSWLVVLLLAGITFWLARPICLRFMEARDYDRRRNVWLGVTTLGFLTPNFWFYAALAGPLMLWAARRDRNPGALFLLLLYAMPPVSVYVPVVGIGQLFDMTHLRLLSFAILLPAAFSPDARANPSGQRTIDSMYGALLAYTALLAVLFMPVETITTTMRRTFLFLIDTVLIYHVFRRASATRAGITEALAMYALACAVMTPIAVFETLRSWLLYFGINGNWDSAAPFSYLLRAGRLRAQAGAGHSLSLGYLLAIGFGVFLYAMERVQAPRTRLLMVVWIWAGLIAALSRAPWLTAVVILITYKAFHPRGLSGMVRTFAGMTGIAAVIAITPLGKEIIAYLPFVGTVDSGNIDYRQALWNTSVDLIKQNPMFGSPFVLSQMEHLRQGQGIIDLMNGYLVVALYYGLVGLALFLTLFMIALTRTYRAWVLAKKLADRELCLLGACLIALMVGTLFFVATAGISPVLYVLAGMMGAYAALKPKPAIQGTGGPVQQQRPAAGARPQHARARGLSA